MRVSGLAVAAVVDFSGDLFYVSDVLLVPSLVVVAVVAGFLRLGNSSSTVLP